MINNNRYTTTTMISTDPAKIENIITRGVERIFPNEDFLRSRLTSGERLTIYFGIDPTGPTLHLGHSIGLIKLAQLQELGHKIILLIGDFTARIGDPDKTNVRKQLTHEEVLANARLYQEQASKILDFEGENKVELVYNGTWLDTMNFAQVLELASHVTVQRMLDRDMFRKRMESGNPIYIHEFMYPLMQGYDSVALQVDGEVGGNDQTFNMLVGRDLLKEQNPPKEKFVIPMKLLVDPSGEKMGKTTGNMLSFLDSAEEQFKKIMTWSDGMILSGFELLTSHDLGEIETRLASDENPRDIKLDLATEIVSYFVSPEAAQEARTIWLNQVQGNAIPESMPELSHQNDIFELLMAGLGESKSQIKRLFAEGAVKVHGQVIDETHVITKGDVFQVGKKRWFKVV
jgi:tyrosyl-tRNA synthetase